VRRHVPAQRAGLRDDVRRRPGRGRRPAGDALGSRLEPAVEGEEADPRSEPDLLDVITVEWPDGHVVGHRPADCDIEPADD